MFKTLLARSYPSLYATRRIPKINVSAYTPYVYGAGAVFSGLTSLVMFEQYTWVQDLASDMLHNQCMPKEFLEEALHNAEKRGFQFAIKEDNKSGYIPLKSCFYNEIENELPTYAKEPAHLLRLLYKLWKVDTNRIYGKVWTPMSLFICDVKDHLVDNTLMNAVLMALSSCLFSASFALSFLGSSECKSVANFSLLCAFSAIFICITALSNHLLRSGLYVRMYETNIDQNLKEMLIRNNIYIKREEYGTHDIVEEHVTMYSPKRDNVWKKPVAIEIDSTKSYNDIKSDPLTGIEVQVADKKIKTALDKIKDSRKSLQQATIFAFGTSVVLVVMMLTGNLAVLAKTELFKGVFAGAAATVITNVLNAFYEFKQAALYQEQATKEMYLINNGFGYLFKLKDDVRKANSFTNRIFPGVLMKGQVMPPTHKLFMRDEEGISYELSMRGPIMMNKESLDT